MNDLIKLSRYEKRPIEIETVDGLRFQGVAEAFPSGYGLHEFGREEESLLIGDCQVFWSDIRRIRVLDADPGAEEEREAENARYLDLIGRLLEEPYWIVDILPERVPANPDGQYFAVDRYFRQPQRLRAVHEKIADLILKLYCYHDLRVTLDGCENWEKEPDPETLAAQISDLPANRFIRILFPKEEAMIDIEGDDTYITVTDPNGLLLDKIRKLAAAAGLFVWQ